MSEPSSKPETVIVEREGNLAKLTLNRPAALNAWNAQFGSRVARRSPGPRRRPGSRAGRDHGAGRAFSSGADLKDISGAGPRPTAPDVYRTSPSATTDNRRHSRDAKP